MTATEFRRELYRVLDEAAESGREVAITHKNRVFRIMPQSVRPIQERLVAHDTLNVAEAPHSGSLSAAWEWNEIQNLDGLS